jgi:hypothetical protein
MHVAGEIRHGVAVKPRLDFILLQQDASPANMADKKFAATPSPPVKEFQTRKPY